MLRLSMCVQEIVCSSCRRGDFCVNLCACVYDKLINKACLSGSCHAPDPVEGLFYVHFSANHKKHIPIFYMIHYVTLYYCLLDMCLWLGQLTVLLLLDIH